MKINQDAFHIAWGMFGVVYLGILLILEFKYNTDLMPRFAFVFGVGWVNFFIVKNVYARKR